MAKWDVHLFPRTKQENIYAIIKEPLIYPQSITHRFVGMEVPGDQKWHVENIKLLDLGLEERHDSGEKLISKMMITTVKKKEEKYETGIITLSILIDICCK